MVVDIETPETHSFAKKSKEKSNKLTTVAMFSADLKDLDNLMVRGERYRDKIHSLILKEKKLKAVLGSTQNE